MLVSSTLTDMQSALSFVFVPLMHRQPVMMDQVLAVNSRFVLESG